MMKRMLFLDLFFIVLSWAASVSAFGPVNRTSNAGRLLIRRPTLSTDLKSAGGYSDARPASASSASQNGGKRRVMQRDQSFGPRSGQPGRRPTRRRNPTGFVMVQDDSMLGSRVRQARVPSGAGSPNLLASFAGKNRVLVISAPHDSDGYYRLMMSLLKPDVYCELAERHVQQIIIFHQEGEMGGKVRRITNEGKILEEPLDTTLVPRLMNFLKLEKGKFGMVLLRKTLQVEERYPYPVRLEAMYETIDQAPMRKFEKVRQKGFVQKCKGAGVEGQVVEGGGTATSALDSETQVDTPRDRKPQKKERKPFQKPAPTASSPATTTAKSTTTRPTTTRSTTTVRVTTAITTTRATTTTTTTTAPLTNQKPTKAQVTPYWIPAPKTTVEPQYGPPTREHRRGKNNPKVTPHPTTLTDYYTKGSLGRYDDNPTDKSNSDRKHSNVAPVGHKPTKPRLGRKKNHGQKVLSNEYDEKFDTRKPATNDLGQSEVEDLPMKKGKGRHDKMEKKKKSDRSGRRDKGEKRSRLGKDGKGEHRLKKKKTSKTQDKEDFQKPLKKPVSPKGSLSSFLDYFESRRRLLLITTPDEDHKMYTQQRDEYLEHVCDMAVRKVSIITIFGTLTNNTMKIEHYQLEHDKPMKVLKEEDLVNQELIIELRKQFGMTHDDFFMVLTDVDMKVKQFYEVPIAMKAVFDYIDTFASRIKEMEQQKREGVMCKKEDKPRSLENFLSRFRWRRRLFIISSPNDEEWAYQQQLYALTRQACNLGLRHVSILKLVGVDAADMGGVLELYPINGSATVEREGLSATLVKDIRNYFQISPEYFSMLLVGKDGNVKSWYPSPMWSMANIYDLIDSMQLRRQEMAIQQSLGLRCPEDEYGGYGYHHHGYHEGYQEGYGQGYGY
ncbi:coiled-coil domain-containing protein 80 precursor-like [Scleropages formosus]|uniref:Coiled-coil domain-containing protein 80 n=1 Tax=Scleropages formosus TaxID=113540 RepID=A0A0P7UR01_SCLFO|nr:coiled-coil domain-containing protein 80 [Scleropages formosus]KPP64362.1 coiled-coil domain-containing protein 80 precursor-like [Scleropages formosus]